MDLACALSNLSAAGRNVSIADGEGEALVVTDDAVVSMADVTLAEGDQGITDFNFVVTLDRPVDAWVSVVSPLPTDLPAADGDYAPVNAAVEFAPGETSKTVTVQLPRQLVRGRRDVLCRSFHLMNSTEP
jgi:hypothetical protein